MHHTDCGISRLGGPEYVGMLSHYFGVSEDEVTAKPRTPMSRCGATSTSCARIHSHPRRLQRQESSTTSRADGPSIPRRFRQWPLRRRSSDFRHLTPLSA
jgi:hypothetical protein